MSRVGKSPIPLPDGVEVSIEGTHVTVKGPRGELDRTFHERLTVLLEDGVLRVERHSEEDLDRALHGLTQSGVRGNWLPGTAAGRMHSFIGRL